MSYQQEDSVNGHHRQGRQEHTHHDKDSNGGERGTERQRAKRAHEE